MSRETKNIDNEDLTTDACPSPPRGENLNIEEILTDTKQVTEEVEEQLPRSSRINGQNSKQKQKKKQSGPVNIINVKGCYGVHFGKSIKYIINKKDENTKNEQSFVKTDMINKLFTCTEPIKREHIMFVSSHVGEGWRDIGRILNYSDGQIYQFEETHINKGIKEVVYQLLLDWIQNEPQNATLGKLTDTLWNSKQESVVKMLSERLIIN